MFHALKKLVKNPSLTRAVLEFYQALFPKICISCLAKPALHSSTPQSPYWEETLCLQCQNAYTPLAKGIELEARRNRCTICGELKREDNELCTACIQFSNLYPWYTDLRIYSLWRYQGLAKVIVKAFKYQARLDLSSALTKALSLNVAKIEQLEGRPFDQIVAVPSSRRALRERGFSHTSILCRKLAKKNKLQFLIAMLQDPSERPSQTQVVDSERYKNVSNRFHAKKTKIKLKRVLLLDDVVTSGASLLEASQKLYELGAEHVSVLSLCRSQAFSKMRLKKLQNTTPTKL